jgi:hypothetical protein
MACLGFTRFFFPLSRCMSLSWSVECERNTYQFFFHPGTKLDINGRHVLKAETWSLRKIGEILGDNQQRIGLENYFT